MEALELDPVQDHPPEKKGPFARGRGCNLGAKYRPVRIKYKCRHPERADTTYSPLVIGPDLVSGGLIGKRVFDNLTAEAGGFCNLLCYFPTMWLNPVDM